MWLRILASQTSSSAQKLMLLSLQKKSYGKFFTVLPQPENDPEGITLGEPTQLKQPMKVGNFVTVQNLGRITDLPAFCKIDRLYPLGFTSTCEFFSMKRPGQKSTYKSEILMGPNDTPLFRVTDLKHGVVTEGKTPTAAWGLMIVEILLGIHEYWGKLALSVRVSDEVCAANVLPSTSSRSAAKTDDPQKKMKIINREVSKVLNIILKKVETIVNNNDDKRPKEKGTASAQPVKKRKPIALRDLVRIGILDPEGPGVVLDYKETKWIGEISKNGTIVYEGNHYETPSSFSISMKQTINPDKMADDGWNSLTYKGRPLSVLKKGLTRAQIQLVDKFRGEYGEDDDKERKRKSTSAPQVTVGDALEDDEDVVNPLNLKGIGEKNFLAGFPKIELLPQPHQILWHQIDITSLVNEQLGAFLFGIDRPKVLDILEALPLSNKPEKYRFRVQRGTKAREISKLNKRNSMIVTRLKKAALRISKHQDAVDRRVEAAGRRQMRIEDRFGRNMRVQSKKDGQAAAAAARRLERLNRIRERQNALEAIKDLREEIKTHRSESKSEEADVIQGQLTLERSAETVLKNEQVRLNTLLEKLESMNQKEQEQIKSEAKRTGEQLEKQHQKVVGLEDRLAKVQEREKSRNEKVKMKEELNQFYEQLEQAKKSIEHFLASAVHEVLPDDLEVISTSKPLTSDTMYRIEPCGISDDLLMIWDFFAKFAPDFQLCDTVENTEGLVIPEGNDVSVDEENDSGGNDDEDNMDDDDDFEVQEEQEEEQEAPTTSKSKKSKKSKETPKKTKERPVYKEGVDRTPVLMLPEVHKSLVNCDMHFLGPAHVGLAEMLFLGTTSVDEQSMSEAAKERSSTLRRYSPINESTWPELLRFFLMITVKQMESGGRDSFSMKEYLHKPSQAVTCIMSRLEDPLEDDNDEEEGEEGEELTQNARRMRRRAAKQKLVTIREEAMNSVLERLHRLALATSGVCESTDVLMLFPPNAKVNANEKPPAVEDVIAAGQLGPHAGNDILSSSTNIVPSEITSLSYRKISSMADWAKKLIQIRDFPSNRGTKIKKTIQDAIALLSASEVALAVQLERCIGSSVFRTNSAGPTKRMALAILAEAIRNGSCFPNDSGEPTKKKLKTEQSNGKTAKRTREVEEDGPGMDVDMVQRCRAVVRAVACEEEADVFAWPVDCKEFGDYLDYVQKPMDLKTIDEGLVKGLYHSPKDVWDDMELIWANCRAYNQRGSPICRVANKLRSTAQSFHKAWIDQERRELQKFPYVYESSLPEAPWGGGSEEILLFDERKNGSEKSSKKRKHKKSSGTAPPFELSSRLKRRGFALSGAQVGKRVARSQRGDTDEIEKGYVVAFSKNAHEWIIQYDDNPETVYVAEPELMEVLGTYETYSAEKKKVKKLKKKLKKEKKKGKKQMEDGEEDGDEKAADEEEEGEEVAKDDEVSSLQPKIEANSVQPDIEVKSEKLQIEANSVQPDNEVQSEKLPTVDVNSTQVVKEEQTVVKPEISQPQGEKDVPLDLGPEEEGCLGTILTKWFKEGGCVEGYVTEYSREKKTFKILYKDLEVEEHVSMDELLELEKKSVLLALGSERNGVEDEAKEIERISAQTITNERTYRKEIVNTENYDPTVVDACAPVPMSRANEIVLMRKLVYLLATKEYEDIDFEMRTQLLRLLCEHTGDTGFLRDVIERRMLITVKTRSKWRMQPPKIERTEESKAIVDQPDDTDEHGILNRLAGDGVAEQNILEKRIASFHKKYEGSLSKKLVKALERVKSDIGKQKEKKRVKNDVKRWKSELEWKLQTIATRPKFLGLDRYSNKYMYFPGDYASLYVNIGELAVRKGMVPDGETGWRVISGKKHLNKFLDSLNVGGQRESSLLTAIQSRSALLVRGERWHKKWQEAELGEQVGDDVKEMKTLVGERLAELSQGGSAEAAPSHFHLESYSGSIIGEAVMERHLKACEDASREGLLRKNSSYQEKCLVDIKVVLLNIEYAVLLCKLENATWMTGLRKGWIRLVTTARNWRDLAQACAFLEVAMVDSVPMENWYYNLYGDAGYALRCKSSSSICARIMSLDTAINYKELKRVSMLKRGGRSRGSKKRKKRT
mmetsp:Transcript_17646/g.38633  ORF Transcript_17646/g.38633 Transcript_17646/m.38633 type:complete len:2095 (-) Transcript_17646:254-6538(-)